MESWRVDKRKQQRFIYIHIRLSYEQMKVTCTNFKMSGVLYIFKEILQYMQQETFEELFKYDFTDV